jgi:hypothetical protein
MLLLLRRQEPLPEVLVQVTIDTDADGFIRQHKAIIDRADSRPLLPFVCLQTTMDSLGKMSLIIRPTNKDTL